ncbi:MAG: restriction endonuclease subunit S [Burkholderiales bacterium]|nr:restriction endonuclease subunit S [Burkholderiales bacterium]
MKRGAASPPEWRNCDISDLCQLQRGFDLTEATRKPGSVPVYSSSGLAYFHSEAKLQPPAVITGRKGLLGTVYFVEEPCWPHDTTLWVKDFKGNDPRFVQIFLNEFGLERFDAATSVPTLNRNNVFGVPIHLPPVSEQRLIAAAIGDVEALLTGLDRLIAKKRDLKQAAMQQLLTGQTRLPGFQGVWAMRPLKAVAEISAGINKPISEMGAGALYVTVQDLYDGTSIRTDRLSRIKVSPAEVEAKGLVAGDIVFGKSSVKREGIGYPSIFLGSAEPTVFSGFTYRARARNGTADAKYLFFALRAEGTRRWLIDNSQASALTNINQKIADAIPIQMPPTLGEQTAIATVLSDMEANLVALEARRDKTRALKQGMMQELLTGRTRLV